MDEQRKNDPSPNMDNIIEMLEQDSFIGRQEEIETFQQFLPLKDPYRKVLHIYGPGGIGKSFLLNEFNRIAKAKGVLSLKMNSGDFSHTPTDFSKELLLLVSQSIRHLDIAFHENNQPYDQQCLDVLSEVSETRQIMITIDTYDQMEGLDRWFRQVFLKQLNANLFIVLSGRKPLQGEWVESLAWRKVTKQMKLSNFNIEQTRAFLAFSNIKQEAFIQTLWQFTEGHPLTLSLATLTSQEIDLTNPTYFSEKLSHILIKLTKVWLEEVIDQALLQITEIAALFTTFDQSSLSAILNKKVSSETFNQLISISFIRQVNNGWTMHELIRDAVRMELQHRNPDLYKQLSDRLVSYYYKKTIATRSTYDISQFFYHVGDEAIQSTFFQDTIDTSMYLESVEHYNFKEVVAFFKNKRENVTENHAHFFDRATNKSVLFHVSKQHNVKESEMINESYIQEMGYDCAKLLKNKWGETLGISIIVPINSTTLPKLMEEPVSRTYFSNLTDKEKQSFNLPAKDDTHFFIRLLDFTEHADTKARSFLLYHLFHLLLSGGKIIASTPLPFFQDLLGRFGFTEVPHAIHDDYGEDAPSFTYILDVSGPNLAIYLEHFMESVSQNNQMKAIEEIFSLTNREKEIVALILEDYSNAAISKQLFIAEVTVKKHMTRILKKMNVKNRTQLVKRMMEFI